MQFVRQTWTLVKKDLIILARRHALSTAIRALLFPILATFVLVYIKVWTATPGLYGIGTPTPIKSLADALAETGSVRPKVIIMNGGFTDGDIGSVVDQLSTTIQNNGKELHILKDDSELQSLCPSSNGGVSNCYGAVQFLASPDHGGRDWNYTIYADASLGGTLSITSSTNDLQLYTLPFQHAIGSAIASTHGGAGLPENMMQYPFTSEAESEKEQLDSQEWQSDIQAFLGFAFFVALSGLTYHLTGHVVHQREQGILQLVDAMMPNRRRWECLAARTLATHIAFDLVYFPGWIATGGLMTIAFPNSSAGYFVLLNLLTGLALSSYSILASSLFRRAQLSAISTIIAALVFALAAQFALNAYNNAQIGGVLATGLLFPPSAYVYFLVATAGFEYNGQALQLNQFVPTIPGLNVPPVWEVTAGTFLGLLVLQILLYPPIAAVIERILHGRSSRSRKLRNSADMAGLAVRLRGFSKHFRNLKDKKMIVKAVDELSLDLHTGSISVLLGANGSGKSTTLNAIAGLETITSGSIELDGTGGIGLCPQKNVMWEELTVREHIQIFEALKRTTPNNAKTPEEEIAGIIEACDLSIKSAAKVKTLSGGQKRRAQLAMMLAGGSRVCCIDEASSGIDPIARRKVWDILLNERGKRTIFFTTHFLDEAEVLSDQVTILSKGKLKAEGSVVLLKNQFGGGYRVILEEDSQKLGPFNFPNVSQQSDYGHAVFEVTDRSDLGSFVSMLEQRGFHQYRIQGPTIESVFLKLTEEMRGESGMAQELLPGTYDSADEYSSTLLTKPLTASQALTLHTGKGCSPLKQVGILFLKRLTILKHNFMPYISALFISLVLAGMVTRFFVDIDPDFLDGVPCTNPKDVAEESFTEYLSSDQFSYGGFVYGPPDVNVTLQRVIPNDTLYFGYSEPPSWSSIPAVGSLAALNSYVSKNSSDLSLGGFFDDSATPTFAWHGLFSGGSPLFLQAAFDSVLMNQTIVFGFQTFKQSFTPVSGIGLLVAVFTTLGFAIYPGLFALYPTAERLRKVRAMQYSNGVLPSSLWLAHLLFDSMFILIISVATVIIWATQYQGWYALGYMFVVFFLYGLAATAFSYVVSLFVSSQLAAIAFTAVIQVIITVLYFMAYVLAAANAPATDVYTWFNYIHYTVGLISPAANLMRALFMAVNSYSLVCRGSAKASYPGEIGIYGAPILYLTLQFIILSVVLMFWESDRSLEVFGIRRKRRAEDGPEKQSGAVDFDAAEDPYRLSTNNTGLRLFDVSKSFGSNRAVEDVTFGILPSEKFALLGPNGAGKSTIISLIRGDLSGHGSVFIGGESLQRSPVAAKNHLGVCPQFDAQDSMTVTEHLRFYARARGVPNKEANIAELVKRLGLQDHRNKLAKKLSGGTQRKLSLAIVLISNPDVLLLDEPSSGMDPAAKRALWATLNAISAGRVVLLTTHSMEEADALCDRAGIMARKLLALGSVEDLRSRHGNAAYVHLVHRDAPYTSEQEMSRIRLWVQESFADAEIEQRTFCGQMRFGIPQRASGNGMGRLFMIIERSKEELGIADYSIGPGTLDQVFLNVVGRHNVREENTEEAEKKGWRRWRR